MYVLLFKPTVKSTKLCTSDNGKHRDGVYFPKYKGAFLTSPAMDFRVMQLNGKLSALYILSCEIRFTSFTLPQSVHFIICIPK